MLSWTGKSLLDASLKTPRHQCGFGLRTPAHSRVPAAQRLGSNARRSQSGIQSRIRRNENGGSEASRMTEAEVWTNAAVEANASAQ
jgi:hypothetical protein